MFPIIQSRETKSLLEKLTSRETTYTAEREKLRSDVERLKTSEEEAKLATSRVLSLQEEMRKLQKELHQAQAEKMMVEKMAEAYKQETDQVSTELEFKAARRGT